jgi:hypothetical protein
MFPRHQVTLLMYPYAVDHNNLLCNKQSERDACQDQHVCVHVRVQSMHMHMDAARARP